MGLHSFSSAGDARVASGSQQREGPLPWTWKASFPTLRGKKDASSLFLNVKSSIAPFQKHSLSCIKFAFKLCVFVLPSLTGTYSSPTGGSHFGHGKNFISTLSFASLYLNNKGIKVMLQISLGHIPIVHWCVWDLLTTIRAGRLRSSRYSKVPEITGFNSLLTVDITVFGHRL